MILVGDSVAVTVVGVQPNGGIRLAVSAPRGVPVGFRPGVIFLASQRAVPDVLGDWLDALPPGFDLRGLVLALAERCAGQSELLARRAEGGRP